MLKIIHTLGKYDQSRIYMRMYLIFHFKIKTHTHYIYIYICVCMREHKGQIHKLESVCKKKKTKALKIPISKIRVIIYNFQSAKDVMNLPGRGRVSMSS